MQGVPKRLRGEAEAMSGDPRVGNDLVRTCGGENSSRSPSGAAMFRRTLVALSLLLSAAGSQARDNGQDTHVSPDVKDWIEGLRDHLGVSCCATADGLRPQEVEWDIAAKRYRVKIEGAWLTVPDGSVIKEPNRLGYAVVWIHEEPDGISIRCFLPGSAT